MTSDELARKRVLELVRQEQRARFERAMGWWSEGGTRADRQRTVPASDPVQAYHERLTAQSVAAAASEASPAPSASEGSVWGVEAWWQWPLVGVVLVGAALVMLAWIVWSVGVMCPLYVLYRAAGGLRWVMERTPVVRGVTD